MADYSSEKLSAYNDIISAGTTINFRRKSTSTYNSTYDIDVSNTALLNGAINSSVTSIVIKTLTGTLVPPGTFWIGNENFYYTTYTLATSTLSGVTRGYGPTDADSHLDEANVYFEVSCVDYSGYALLCEIKDDQIDSTPIEKNDLMFLVPSYGLTITPNQDDLIILNSVIYNIFSIKKISPSNDPILYKIYTRPA